jgi:hypothetical protein
MSAASVRENVVARKLLTDIKAGELLKGVVSSSSTSGSQELAWIIIQLPLLGERRVSVKNESGLRPGQKVLLRCVPDPVQPQRYVFQLADAVFSTWPQRLSQFWHGKAENDQRPCLN